MRLIRVHTMGVETMLELKFSTANAAFDELEHECTCILLAVAAEIGRGKKEGICRDSNGNTVGKWSLK